MFRRLAETYVSPNPGNYNTGIKHNNSINPNNSIAQDILKTIHKKLNPVQKESFVQQSTPDLETISASQLSRDIKQFNRAIQDITIQNINKKNDTYDISPVMKELETAIEKVNQICIPGVSGQLSARCLYNNVVEGGCTPEGALALALANPGKNYIDSISNTDSIKLYNTFARPPLNMDVFRDGSATIQTVLKEVSQLSQNATDPKTVGTPVGESARELCLQKGTLDKYNFCTDLPDTYTPPFDIRCLQSLFLEFGGTMKGQMYPSVNNHIQYNNLQNVGAVKQYIMGLKTGLESDDYTTQRTSTLALLGITPEMLIPRAPYIQGVEIFWFSLNPQNGGGAPGFLRRTIEYDIPQFPVGSTSVIPQVGFVEYAGFLAITDIRAGKDSVIQFTVQSDDGFWIALNQPQSFDWYAVQHRLADDPGFFSANIIQGPTIYQSISPTNVMGQFPNIMKVQWNDAGGGGHTFQITNTLDKSQYTLTLEKRAPFLCYEVNTITQTVEDTRNPQIFSKFTMVSNVEYHVRTEEREYSPGKKGFIRFNGSQSFYALSNIAYQSWSSVNIAIRINTMPVKDTVCSLLSAGYYVNIVFTPQNGSTASVSFLHNMTTGFKNTVISSVFTISMNVWYLININQTNNTGFTVNIRSFEDIINTKGTVTRGISLQAPGAIYYENGLYNTPTGNCAINIGSKNNGSSRFIYDIAFIHFFQQSCSADDLYRDCMCNWIYTQFPDAYPNTYKIIQ